MPTAKISKPDGTTITVEVTFEELEKLIGHRSGVSQTPSSQQQTQQAAPQRTQEHSESKGAELSRKVADIDQNDISDGEPDVSQIVGKIKDCEEAHLIEQLILDKRNLLNRVLLPLYVSHKYFGDRFGFTSGDVNRITTELSVPVATPHASTTLSDTARAYVIGDKVRKRGSAVRYKLSRRGFQYVEGVLEGKTE
jgi:hypothetical protein